MNFTLYFFAFCFIWWITFFIVLPIGIKIEEKAQPGHADSAPINPRIMYKLLLTTIITVILLAVLIYTVEHGYLDKIISIIKTYDSHY
jgi:predicted secreted protein